MSLPDFFHHPKAIHGDLLANAEALLEKLGVLPICALLLSQAKGVSLSNWVKDDKGDI